MPWQPQDAIDQARDYHPAFSDRQTPESVALRHIDTYEEELYQALVQRESDTVVNTESISLPLADFNAGYALPDFMELRGGEVFWDTDDLHEPLHLVPFGNRHAPGFQYPAYVINGTLHLIGKKEDWQHLSKVELYYVPERATLTAPDQQATIPRTMLPAVVEKLALFMAQRGPAGDEDQPIELSLTVEDWRRTEQRVLGTVANERRSESGVVRSVW